jgi:hypothetical protein
MMEVGRGGADFQVEVYQRNSGDLPSEMLFAEPHRSAKLEAFSLLNK